MSRHVMQIKTEELRKEAIRILSKAALGFRIEFSRNVRSLEQNDLMWAMLGEISKVALHHGKKFEPNDWKIMFMAELGHEMRIAPSLSGRNFVSLGVRSSKLTVAEMSDLIEFIRAWCAEQNITLTDPRNGDITK